MTCFLSNLTCVVYSIFTMLHFITLEVPQFIACTDYYKISKQFN